MLGRGSGPGVVRGSASAGLSQIVCGAELSWSGGSCLRFLNRGQSSRRGMNDGLYDRGIGTVGRFLVMVRGDFACLPTSKRSRP